MICQIQFYCDFIPRAVTSSLMSLYFIKGEHLSAAFWAHGLQSCRGAEQKKLAVDLGMMSSPWRLQCLKTGPVVCCAEQQVRFYSDTQILFCPGSRHCLCLYVLWVAAWRVLALVLAFPLCWNQSYVILICQSPKPNYFLLSQYKVTAKLINVIYAE